MNDNDDDNNDKYILLDAIEVCECELVLDSVWYNSIITFILDLSCDGVIHVHIFQLKKCSSIAWLSHISIVLYVFYERRLRLRQIIYTSIHVKRAYVICHYAFASSNHQKQ